MTVFVKFNCAVVAVTPSRIFNSTADTSEAAILPLLSVTTATAANKSSVSIVDPAPVRVFVEIDHAPAPLPSEVQTSLLVPEDVIKYSLFSTLLADNVPSAKSARSAS